MGMKFSRFNPRSTTATRMTHMSQLLDFTSQYLYLTLAEQLLTCDGLKNIEDKACVNRILVQMMPIQAYVVVNACTDVGLLHVIYYVVVNACTDVGVLHVIYYKLISVCVFFLFQFPLFVPIQNLSFVELNLLINLFNPRSKYFENN